MTTGTNLVTGLQAWLNGTGLLLARFRTNIYRKVSRNLALELPEHACENLLCSVKPGALYACLKCRSEECRTCTLFSEVAQVLMVESRKNISSGTLVLADGRSISLEARLLNILVNIYSKK